MLIRLIFMNAKVMPTNDTNYSCYIKAVEHVGSISHYKLLIASGADTHTHKHTHIRTDVHTESILRNQACPSL